MKLINELKASGDLIDVYSEEYFQKRNDDEFNKESFKDLIKKHGDEFTHHLLVGCFHSSRLHILVNQFKPCREFFENCYRHNYYDTQPCFAIINLKNKSVCLMCIGNRKGHYYEDYFNVSMKNIVVAKNRFGKYDYCGIVEKLRNSLENIANVMNKLAYEEDDVSDEDIEEMRFEEWYLQNIFPKFSYDVIIEASRPF